MLGNSKHKFIGEVATIYILKVRSVITQLVLIEIWED